MQETLREMERFSPIGSNILHKSGVRGGRVLGVGLCLDIYWGICASFVGFNGGSLCLYLRVRKVHSCVVVCLHIALRWVI